MLELSKFAISTIEIDEILETVCGFKTKNDPHFQNCLYVWKGFKFIFLHLHSNSCP